MNPDCYYGDHTWNGTSQCVHCGERLRCSCGCYVRDDRFDEHILKCRKWAPFMQGDPTEPIDA